MAPVASAVGTGRAVLLRDGTVAVIRGLTQADRGGLMALHDGLSPRTLYLRFFSASKLSSERYVTRLLRPEAADHDGLLLEVNGRIVGVAAYEQVPAEPPQSQVMAEVAFVVADDQHGRGIGTLLLEHIASVARRAGVSQFTAETLPDNAPMLGVFRQAGYDITLRPSRDDVHVTIDLKPGSGLLSALDGRERQATCASLEPLLRPRSVAVVGASSNRRSVGGVVVRNIVRAGFAGGVYPINRRVAAQRGRRTVHGLPAYAQLADVPGPVDLVVAAVPAPAVLHLIDECAVAGVRAMVVLSAGFADVGPEGAIREAELLKSARRAGIRLVGPNCLGILSMTAGVQLAATFAPHLPLAGSVGVLSQSGGVGIALLEHTLRAGIGVSTFVSVGNKADVSGTDLLTWWDDDPATDIVALYLESFGNPRSFARLARHISLRKPIVAIKAGRTPAGLRAAHSHTAGPATPSRSAAALFRQAGIISVDHIGELIDVVTLLSTQPLVAGPRLAIVGTAGGLNVLAADAASECGLIVPTLTDAVQARLREVLPAGAAVGNPVDVMASAGSDQFAGAVSVLLADPGIDAVLGVITPTILNTLTDMTTALVGAAAGSPKPVLATVIGFTTETVLLGSARAGPVPVYAYPESAARALAQTYEYRRFRDQPTGSVPYFADIRADAARAVIAAALDAPRDGGWLDPGRVSELLETYGIHVRDIADIFYFEDIDDIDDIAAVESGVEVVVGVTGDPSFGPLVSFGLGGAWTDLLADQAFRLVPLTDVDATELVGAIRSAPLLNGYRGAPQCDIEAIKQLLLRVAQLADDNPELVELNLNPVVATASGVVVVSAAARVARAPLGRDPYARQLR